MKYQLHGWLKVPAISKAILSNEQADLYSDSKTVESEIA